MTKTLCINWVHFYLFVYFSTLIYVFVQLIKNVLLLQKRHKIVPLLFKNV